ncbi:sulfurtransferase [Ovoidimarina sediminis]|uniref:sulfurtransferase n=1 Tax=Ovoidimarina sediminis TaxID=3079856 RepID=UPI00290EED67|nr:rhodanese-like domain-containing protein [Rhodophyticola sp. MJ-SS7]MDU8945115.1 rhodanese-like domain-containing protein [Rhodophyticola sp. MJ-SS7]
MDQLVTPGWLAARLDDPATVVLDCSVRMIDLPDGGMRVESGRADYLDSHIPGAGFADLTGALRDAESRLAFALPAPGQFAAAMADLGVGDRTRVVLYDRNGQAWAARVWWMLRWIGHDDAALLDGGLAAWAAAGGALRGGAETAEARHLTARPRPRLMADRDAVTAALGDPAQRVIDTLPAEIYRGDVQMYARPGHIAGAEHQPGMDLLDASGRFLPDAALAEHLPGDRAARAITYCGGGILASLSAFAMTRVGFEDVAVYIGSLEEWAADPAAPMETGDPPKS